MNKMENFPILKLDESDNDELAAEVLEAFDQSYDQALRNWGTFIDEADHDLAFYLGDQWSANDKSNLALQKRAALVFNKVRRIVKMVEGYERKTRVSLIANPVENGDEKVADQLTTVVLWLMNYANIHMTMSEAFGGSLKTGINLVELFVDYMDDPLSGDIKATRIPHNSFLLDPRFEKRDLSDCEYMIRRKYVSKEAAKAMLPFREREIELMPTGGHDEKFPNMPHSRDASGRQTVRYDEFWRKKYRDIDYLIDMETGETRKWEGDERALRMFRVTYPQVQVFKRKEQYTELNIIVENQLMYSGQNPWKTRAFPFIPVMAFWDPEYSAISSMEDYSLKLQGIVRCMRDPQIEINKRRSKALDIMDSGIHSGWKAKEGSVSNPKSLYRAGNNGVIWMKNDAPMTDAERLPPGDIPPSLVQLSEMFDRDLTEIAGASSELLAMPENDNTPISGILAKVRQGAGITILQDLFDNYRYSQKLLGTLILEMVQKNYHKSKIKRIINEEPVPEFFDTTGLKYDISVEEAIETPSQKNLFYMQLLQAKQVGVPIPDSLIIEAMPSQGKDKILKALQQGEQQQAEIQKVETEQRQMINRLSQAKIVSDVGMGVERIARAEADKALAVERISESKQNQSQAILNKAEAIVKMAQLRDDQVLKWMEFLKATESEQHQRQKVEKQQNIAQVQQSTQELSNLIGTGAAQAS